jgi:hypothetical protein
MKKKSIMDIHVYGSDQQYQIGMPRHRHHRGQRRHPTEIAVSQYEAEIDAVFPKPDGDS